MESRFLTRGVHCVILSVVIAVGFASGQVIPHKLDMTISGSRNVALWTDIALADIAAVFEVDQSITWESSDLNNLTDVEDFAPEPGENVLFLFECMSDTAETIGHRIDVTDVCLCYYDNDLQAVGRETKLYPCDTVTNAARVKQEVTAGLIQQGKWRNVVNIGDGELLVQWDEEEMTAPGADLACNHPVTYVGDIVTSIHFLGDYVNVIIDCPLNTTVAILDELHKRSTAQINHISYNLLLLDVDPSDMDELYVYTRDGDDVVIPEIDYTEVTLRHVLHTLLAQPPDSFPLMTTSTLHWCLTSCFLGPENMRTTAAWDRAGQIFEYYAVFLPADFIQFHGRHMSVVCETYKPFCYHEVIDGEAVYYGIEVEIVRTLSEKFNFTFEVGPSDDGNWGVETESGWWNGMVGMVKRQEADIAVAGITVSPTRDAVIDFLFPHYESPSAVILKLQQFKWFYFIKPFAYYLWVVMLVLPLFVTFILTIIHAFREFRLGATYDDHPTSKIDSKCPTRSTARRVVYMFLNNAFLLYGMQVLQGNVLPGKSHSVRCVVGTFWLVAIMMAAVYSGNLTASLAVKDVRMPFNTLSELAADEQYIFQIESGTFREQLFRDATRGVYKRLWDKILRNFDKSVIDSSLEAKDNVLKGYHTYTGSKINLEEFIRDIEDCDLVLLKEEYYKAGFGVVVKQGMPFKKHYDLIVETLADTGLLKRWTDQHSTKDTCASLAGETTTNAITISDISLILEMLLGVPLAIAGLTLVIERLLKCGIPDKLRELREKMKRKDDNRIQPF